MMKGPFILKNGMYLSTLRQLVMFLGDAFCLESIIAICRLPCVLGWVWEPFRGVNYWCYSSFLVTAALLTWHETRAALMSSAEPHFAAPSGDPAPQHTVK